MTNNQRSVNHHSGQLGYHAERLLLELLEDELPAVAILDVILRDGIVTLLAEALRAQNVPFVVASAYSRPELIGGEILAGAPNVGKPTEERRLLTVLEKAVRS